MVFTRVVQSTASTDSTGTHALSAQADELIAAGRAADAVPLLDQATAIRPRDSGLWLRLAAALLAVEGGTDADVRARDAAERAVTLDTHSAVGFRLLSEASLRLGETTAALAATRAAVQVQPRSWVAHLDLAAALGGDPRHHREARRAALRAADLAPPGRAEPHLVLAEFAARDGDWATAASAFQDAIAASPDDERARHGLADARARLAGGDTADAAPTTQLPRIPRPYPRLRGRRAAGRTADDRTSDNWAAENWAAENRATDSRAAEDQAADRYDPESRAAENWAPGSGPAESGAAASRTGGDWTAANWAAPDQHPDAGQPGVGGPDGWSADARGADPLVADQLGADQLAADLVGADPLAADRLGAGPIGANPLGADSRNAGPRSAGPRSAVPRSADLRSADSQQELAQSLAGPGAARAMGNQLAVLAAVQAAAIGLLLLAVPAVPARWHATVSLLTLGGIGLLAAATVAGMRSSLAYLPARLSALAPLAGSVGLLLVSLGSVAIGGLAGAVIPGSSEYLRFALVPALLAHLTGHLAARFAEVRGRSAGTEDENAQSGQGIRAGVWLGLGLSNLLHGLGLAVLAVLAGLMPDRVYLLIVIAVVLPVTFLDAVQLAALLHRLRLHRRRFHWWPYAAIFGLVATIMVSGAGFGGALLIAYGAATEGMLVVAAAVSAVLATGCMIATLRLRRQ